MHSGICLCYVQKSQLKSTQRITLKYVQISHELLSEDHQYPLFHFTVNGKSVEITKTQVTSNNSGHFPELFSQERTTSLSSGTQEKGPYVAMKEMTTIIPPQMLTEAHRPLRDSPEALLKASATS